MNYDQVVVQLGGEGHFEPAQFYFDDLQLMGASGNGTLTFYPENGSTDVEITVNPALNFSVPVTLANGDAISNNDITSIVTFRETNAGGTPVPFTGTINAEKTVITINPVTDLDYGQLYYLALNNEVIRYENADLIAGQNITFTTEISIKPYVALDVQDNFENNGWGTIEEWLFQDPEFVPLTITTDPVNSSNHVADYNRSGTFEWTNAQFVLNHRMDLHQRKLFELEVYFPSTNNYTGSLTPTASIKLQNSLLGPNAWTTQTEVKETVQTFDQWVTITFDFSLAADSMNYDQVVVQLGGEGHLETAQFYFDDIQLLDSSISVQEKPAEFLSVYPNPVSETLYISSVKNLSLVEIFNATGQRVDFIRDITQQIQVGYLPAGLYSIVAHTFNGEYFITKVLVSK
jgi:hypothetical protein